MSYAGNLSRSKGYAELVFCALEWSVLLLLENLGDRQSMDFYENFEFCQQSRGQCGLVLIHQLTVKSNRQLH